jgi:tetratricopeptide (TPR) repeat protein
MVVSLLLPLLAAQAGGAAPTQDEIARAIEQLGSGNFRMRQKASALLWAAGKAAEPALLKALKSKDQEVARRARDILDKFKYGIYPNTPKNVVDLIGRYRSGGEDVKRVVMRDLNRLGTPGHAVLIKLAAQETNVGFRKELFELLTGDVVPGLLGDGRFDEVEELLELGLKDGDEQASRNFAAYLLLRGRLDARIPEWSKKAKKLTGYQAAEVLMYMYRAKGDLKNARLAAKRTEKKPLLATLLIEQAAWKELAANPELIPTDNPDPFDQLAHTAAYHRLAGNAGEFAKAIAAVQEFGAKNPLYAQRAGQVLLLNDRPKEAIELLAKNNRIAAAFELLAAQHRYKEAFDLAAKVQANQDAEELLNLRMAEARVHAELGDRDQAARVLAKLADAPPNPRDCSGSLEAIKTAYDLGLKDQAFAHAGRVVAQAHKEGRLEKMFEDVFPEQDGQALVWWKFFRQLNDKESAADRLKRVREVLDRKVAARDFADLVKAVERAAAGLPRPEQQAQWRQALGETCLAYGQQELGHTYLEKANSEAALTRLGDLLADKKLWLQAADRYAQAWAKDRSKAAPLYLRGWCLSRAGQKDEGKKWMDLAHLIPLANDRVRFNLARAMARHGLNQVSDSERDLLLRTGRLNYVQVSNALRSLAQAAYARGDYELAANCHERTMLVCLGNIYFIRTSAYLTVPALTHHIRARGLLVRGKLEEARKEIELGLAELPGDIESAIHLVPDLDRRKYKQEADELFNRVFEHFEKVCKAYPKSAQHHNSAAWLAVCCRRQMDRALEHARQAVALAPRTAGYLDTLAEVHYQRGDRAEAIKLMKKCIELDPKSNYYRKQVQRFEAKGPPSETPR